MNSDSSHAKRVLVVDDNKDAADSLSRVLTAYGHETRSVYTGSSALEVAETFKPDTILLDLGLPTLDGYEVARQIRENSQLSDTQLIAVTGFGQQRDFERSHAVGFDAHFVKPVDPAVIQDLLTKVFHRQVSNGS